MLAGNGINVVNLCGRIESAAVFSHRTHDRNFWILPLAVGRHSGVDDVIRIMISEDKLCACGVSPGSKIRLCGQFRSFNSRTDSKNRLILTVFATDLKIADDCAPENNILLEGLLCKPPVYRKTPLGREICDLMLAVGRKYGRADYLPCIVWGASARACSEYPAGTRLRLEGRVQSRKYMKETGGVFQEKTAYEVSVFSVQRIGSSNT